MPGRRSCSGTLRTTMAATTSRISSSLTRSGRLMAKKKPKAVRPVVFTGPTSILAAQVAYVQEVLDALKANVFISGGAPGIDQFVWGEIHRTRPNAKQLVVVP